MHELCTTRTAQPQPDPDSDSDLADWPANQTGRGTHDHFPCTAHQETHQPMLADLAIRSLPGRLGLEERRSECPVGLGRGDCDAAHEILKTNMKTIIYQSYDIIVSI